MVRIWIVLLVGMVAVRGLAQDSTATTTAEREAAARQHFARGRAAYEQGKFDVALDAWQASYAITQHPKLLYNIGLASQKLGHVTEAIEAFENYLAWGEGDREEEVRGRLAALRDLANRDATFAGAQPAAEPARVPPPEAVAHAAIRSPEPDLAPAVPQSPRESPPRRWWPYAVAGGVAAVIAVAIAVPLARRDTGDPDVVMPNTGLTVEALWSGP